MNRHVAPGRPSDGAPPPEPPYAERARTLVYLARSGTLCTLSVKHPGHPFGSLMPYAPDERGRPLVLLSAMAVHTLKLDCRASLLVTQPAWTGDPLAAGRVTLTGQVWQLAEGEAAEARPVYLARHPNACYWVDFEDFGFYRLDVADVYFVGGFAAMGWVPAEDYVAARPDPLADAAAGIVEHMNRDHADALITLARALAGVRANEASMVSVDRLGIKLGIKSGEGRSSARIPFPREVSTPDGCRAVLMEMLRVARQGAHP